MEGRASRSMMDRAFLAGFVGLVVLQAVALYLQLSTDAPVPVASVLLTAFLVAAMLRIHGPWGTMAFVALVVAIPFASEFSGVLAGVPYGTYRYVAAPGPWAFGLVPVFILIGWIGIGYMAIGTTTAALGRSRWWLAPLDGLVAMGWDLIVDPLAVRLDYWRWGGAGGLYGIPLTNFLGWFLVVTLLSLAVRWAWARDVRAPARTSRRMVGLVPAALLVSGTVFGAQAWAYGFTLSALLGLAILAPAVGAAAWRLRAWPPAAAPTPWRAPAAGRAAAGPADGP